MSWWTAADIVGGVVLLPALTVTFGRLVGTLRRILGEIEPISQNCVSLAADLHSLPRLAETEVLTGAGVAGVVRCKDALAAAL
jgi:hypothetical protein